MDEAILIIRLKGQMYMYRYVHIYISGTLTNGITHVTDAVAQRNDLQKRQSSVFKPEHPNLHHYMSPLGTYVCLLLSARYSRCKLIDVHCEQTRQSSRTQGAPACNVLLRDVERFARYRHVYSSTTKVRFLQDVNTAVPDEQSP